MTTPRIDYERGHGQTASSRMATSARSKHVQDAAKMLRVVTWTSVFLALTGMAIYQFFAQSRFDSQMDELSAGIEQLEGGLEFFDSDGR